MRYGRKITTKIRITFLQWEVFCEIDLVIEGKIIMRPVIKVTEDAVFVNK